MASLNSYEPVGAQLINAIAPAMYRLEEAEGGDAPAEAVAQVLVELRDALALIRLISADGYRLDDTPTG